MGGVLECMTKKRANEFKDMLTNCPQDAMCTALYNCKVKGCGCVEGKCIGSE
jgi:hypothetical protein